MGFNSQRACLLNKLLQIRGKKKLQYRVPKLNEECKDNLQVSHYEVEDRLELLCV